MRALQGYLGYCLGLGVRDSRLLWRKRPFVEVMLMVMEGGGVPHEQKMLKGHLPRVIYHREYFSIRRGSAVCGGRKCNSWRGKSQFMEGEVPSRNDVFYVDGACHLRTRCFTECLVFGWAEAVCERKFFTDNLLVRIHCIIVMIR